MVLHNIFLRAEAVNNVFNDFKKEKTHFQTSSEYSSNQINNKRDREPRLPGTWSSPVISKHNQFVSNIQFGSWSLERKGEEQQSSQLDSLVSNSLLDFTKPNLALRNEGISPKKNIFHQIWFFFRNIQWDQQNWGIKRRLTDSNYDLAQLKIKQRNCTSSTKIHLILLICNLLVRLITLKKH